MTRPQTHVLGRLVLEPAVRTPERVSALWDRLGRLGAGDLAAAIDELLSGLVGPDQVIQIDRLVIDAGHVREDRLEQDLIEGTRRALLEALRALIGTDPWPADREPSRSARGRHDPTSTTGAGAPAAPDRRTPERRLAETVRFLLVHGALPWWHSSAEPDGLPDLLRAALGQSPDDTRRALVGAGQDARARRRLALQLPTPALHEIVRLVEAGQAAFVIDYVTALERNQAEQPFVPATATDFRVATWELVLAYLLVERGSQFNRKMFVSSTIAAMARHFGLDSRALLFELRRALPRVSRAEEPLRALLDELWDEQAGATAPSDGRSGEPARAAAAQRDERLALVSALLGRGLPPAESVPVFDEAFRALRYEPGRLRWVLLAHWHRERVRQRLADRPDELLTELVHVVIPAHAAEVIRYGRTLQHAHATRPIVAGDAASFRRARWRFFLDTLVLQHGSAFNTRVFIRTTLERIAGHYNTTYDALVPWLWRELGDLPRSPTGAHPVVVHLGALVRELHAQRGEPPRTAAPRSAPTEGPASHRTARALPSVLDLIPPDQRTLTRAVVRFVETLPELATGGFGRGLGAGAITARVRRMALELVRARRGRPLRPVDLLDGLIGQVARDSGVPRERVVHWALRRQAQRGSVRDEVRGLVEQLARASGIPAPARGGAAGRSDGAGDDPVRALTGFLLRGTADAPPGRAGSRLVAWIDRIEREAPAQLRTRIAELLRDAPARRRVLAAAGAEAGNLALTRLWAWRRPEQREAVTQAVAAIEDLGRALASSRHARALHDAFWQFLWTRRASRARRGAQLLALFVEQLARREPRLLARVRSRDAGDRLVERALAGGTRTAAPKPRGDGHAVPRDAASAPVFVDAADQAMLKRWSAAHPEARSAVAEAIAALGRALFSPGYRDAERAALRAAFWDFAWSSEAARPERGAQLLAVFFERLARDAPALLAVLRGSPAGERLVESVRPPASRGAEAPRSAERGARDWLVRTAGVVLLANLLQRYFERLGLIDTAAFRDLAAQERACGLIHFLASGQTELREPDLVLGKLLCGLDLEAPVPVRVEVDEATRAVSDSLLAFVLASWKGIGGTTIQGLRGSFLCRDGRLSRREDDDGWVLDVERRTHDILLGSFPWQTSIVKLPWMPQPLFVHWR